MQQDKHARSAQGDCAAYAMSKLCVFRGFCKVSNYRTYSAAVHALSNLHHHLIQSLVHHGTNEQKTTGCSAERTNSIKFDDIGAKLCKLWNCSNEKLRATMNLENVPDQSLTRAQWKPHHTAMLFAVLRTISPPQTMEGKGWFSTFVKSIANACKTPQSKLLLKFTSQTLLPHVKTFYSTSPNGIAQNCNFSTWRAGIANQKIDLATQQEAHPERQPRPTSARSAKCHQHSVAISSRPASQHQTAAAPFCKICSAARRLGSETIRRTRCKA